ncbi:hypothetical protein D6D10_06045, partial [Aureobasidium pullulans]
VEKLHLEKEHNELYETALDFENNKPGEVKNPLAGLTKAEIFRNVETYAQKYELNDIVDLLKKGALVAQNPGHPEAIEELSARELESIQAEKTHRWRHPKTLYAMVALNSVGAAIQGWDQTGSNGANLSFPQEFGIADTGTVCESIGNCERNSWVVGAINAAPYMALCVIACWLLDPVNHYIGRRGAIFVGAIFSLLAPIGQALAQSWPQILICRILLGIGMGLKEVTVPIFSAENAPASIRGALVMSWQMWVTFGMMLGFSANLAVSGAGDITWRLQLGSACIPAIPLLIGIYLVPESARWLIKKGRHQASAPRSFMTPASLTPSDRLFSNINPFRTSVIIILRCGTQAHLPNKAIIPAPSRKQPTMNPILLLSSVLFGSNRKSLAKSSTKPVKINMPALIESSIPLTTFAVKEFGSYVVRSPSPMAIAMEVVRP